MKPFIPFELPIKNINFERLIKLVAEANKKLSLYNGSLQVMINPHVLLAPLTSKEAVLSSKIEGTQVSFTELLQFEADDKLNGVVNINDIDEIINYKKAIIEAEKMFIDRPFIHLNMVKKLHSILLSGVRGNNKSRGEFRKVQVYIGSVNSNIEQATYIPPESQNIMPALDNWEKYINSNIQETLMQCAIMYAQFGIIHPFLDGNGRMGRILIPLFLYQKDCIDKPVFYMSEFFEEVYIGSVNSNIEQATYIPPESQNIMPALDNWEKYINSDIQETLMQCAIMYVQFGIIHPFLDGNGRMRRILIPLFLYQKDCIDKPVFYTSEFFEENRQEYYLTLNNISQNGNWNEWIEFFLRGVIVQSNKNVLKSKQIIALYNEMKEQIIDITHSSFAISVLDNLFKKPIISASELAKKSNIQSTSTSNTLFKKLLSNDIIVIEKEASGTRSAVFVFDKLIQIIDK